MAQASLTVRRTCRADTKVEHSEPTFRIRCGWRLTDKSYSRDNRLVPPKSSYRRRSSAPRCRLTLARRWRSCQAFGCSPIKKVRELGSDRTEPHPNPLLVKARGKKGFCTVWTLRGNRIVRIWTVLIEDNYTIKLVSRRHCIEIYSEKLTYIGETRLPKWRG